MLLDTGADVTVVPDFVLEAVDATREKALYEVEYLDGEALPMSSVYLQMRWLGYRFTGSFLITTAGYGVIGRNVLNRVQLLLDGPGLQWHVR